MRLERLALALLLVLAGCGSEKKEPTKGTAAGEILEGSASDAMLPIDQVRSQAPLAPRSESDGSGHGKDDSDAEAADGASPGASDQPAGEPANGGASPGPAKPSAE